MDDPRLDSAQVHVWTASLSAGREALGYYLTLLADDERMRAERFRLPKIRERFIVARATLRRLLSVYLRTDPWLLRIGYSAQEKPYLASCPELCFNLSHAEDTALYTVASRRDVGIDIERITHRVEMEGVARHAFSTSEYDALTALTPEARTSAFFHCWTRKEAYVKAHGNGLGYPTRSFSVSLLPGDDDALLADEREANALLNWRLIEINAPNGFCAALAAAGRDWSVLRFDTQTLPPLPNAERRC